jgi:NAD(P)-dependent dehydrogenase (short-subunit alcohol dehydrogenase family)
MNNAEIEGQGFKVAEMPTENFDKAIKKNLYGSFFCPRRFIKELVSQLEIKKTGSKIRFFKMSFFGHLIWRRDNQIPDHLQRYLPWLRL